MLLMLSHDECLDAKLANGTTNYYKNIAMAMVLWWILLFEKFTWFVLQIEIHSRTISIIRMLIIANDYSFYLSSKHKNKHHSITNVRLLFFFYYLFKTNINITPQTPNINASKCCVCCFGFVFGFVFVFIFVFSWIFSIVIRNVCSMYMKERSVCYGSLFWIECSIYVDYSSEHSGTSL